MASPEPMEVEYSFDPDRELRYRAHSGVVRSNSDTLMKPGSEALSLTRHEPEHAVHAPPVKSILFPYVLYGYIQLFTNLVLLAGAFWIVWQFVSSVQTDIESKVYIFSQEVIDQMDKCTRDYRENRCALETRVPALDKVCRSWELCMNQDPMQVARRSKMTAETIGESVNGFFEALSWKSIGCLCLLCMAVILLQQIASFYSRQNMHRVVSDLRVAGFEPASSWSEGGPRPYPPYRHGYPPRPYHAYGG